MSLRSKFDPPSYGRRAVPAERPGERTDGHVGGWAAFRPKTGANVVGSRALVWAPEPRGARVRRYLGRTVGRRASRLGRSLRLAWPVFLIFLAQRLLTLALVYYEGAGDVSNLADRWDAKWYVALAENGYVYPVLAPDGSARASNLAYFPLFPWLVREVADLGVLTVSQASVVVSWIGGLFAVWMIFAVGNALYGRLTGIALAALWGMAPASLALTMGYPEGMFTAAAAAALLCLIRRRPVWAGVCAIVAGLLRPSAVAVVAMVGVYFLVELGRWIARRRSRSVGAVALVENGAEQAGPRRDVLRPGRAFLGAVLSTLGVGAFMVYVGMRTGEVFGYFQVQAQWGQRTAGWLEYWTGMELGLFAETPPASLIPVTIVVSMGYVLLFCLIVFDRRLVWASVYAAVMLVLSLTHITFQHVYARQLLPAFVLLIPLARMPVPRTGAIAALTLGSILMSWGSAHFLLSPTAGM